MTVWAVLVPESLAYATIAGVSPVVGLYAAPPALVIAHEIGQVSDTMERTGIESDPAGALPVFATVEASVASVRTR